MEKLATAEVDTTMPGYTHLQRAQPVRLAHYSGDREMLIVTSRDSANAWKGST